MLFNCFKNGKIHVSCTAFRPVARAIHQGREFDATRVAKHPSIYLNCGVGSTVSSPSGARSKSPAANAFLCILSSKIAPDGDVFVVFMQRFLVKADREGDSIEPMERLWLRVWRYLLTSSLLLSRD